MARVLGSLVLCKRIRSEPHPQDPSLELPSPGRRRGSLPVGSAPAGGRCLQEGALSSGLHSIPVPSLGSVSQGAEGRSPPPHRAPRRQGPGAPPPPPAPSGRGRTRPRGCRCHQQLEQEGRGIPLPGSHFWRHKTATLRVNRVQHKRERLV